MPPDMQTRWPSPANESRSSCTTAALTGLHKFLNGGIEAEYREPICPGDVITSVTQLAPYEERQGRLGLMLFTRVQDTWTNQQSQFVKRSISTQIRY
jgi:hypothetical protein